MFENLLNLQHLSPLSLFIPDELYIKTVKIQLCKLVTISSSSPYTLLIRRYTFTTCNIRCLSTNVIAGAAIHARVLIMGMMNLPKTIDV